MGQGAHISLDSLKLSPCLMVKIQSDSLIPDATVEMLRKWFQVRLQTDNVQLDYVLTERIQTESAPNDSNQNDPAQN